MIRINNTNKAYVEINQMYYMIEWLSTSGKIQMTLVQNTKLYPIIRSIAYKCLDSIQLQFFPNEPLKQATIEVYSNLKIRMIKNSLQRFVPQRTQVQYKLPF
jgi:hypothetical protein